MNERFDCPALAEFCTDVLHAAGMTQAMAETTANGLLEADMYGHSTHGLALLAEYIEEIDLGNMAVAGEPDVLSDRGAVACWDAKRLPGIWTTVEAVNSAVARTEQHGIGAVAIRRSHHIACLASFLEAPARAGHLIMVLSSDPSDAHVAPYGATTPVMTPNPIAAGIPRTPDPILLDVSMSITTAGMCARAGEERRELPHPWLMTVDGKQTADPRTLGEGGSILPVGGLDHGHKGFALGLLVEALTQGLSGYGRADGPTEWGASVLVLAFAPDAFGGQSGFLRQVDWLAQACLGAQPKSQDQGVRLPGQAALERKANALGEGVLLYPGISASLRALAARFGKPMPDPVYTAPG